MAIPQDAWLFAVAIVRLEDRFLLVHERKHGQRWYVPAGRVEHGESLEAAACRETLEETGVRIRLCGVLRLEWTHSLEAVRVRAVFLAEPQEDPLPKQAPDEHSLGAAWVRLEELDRYPLRGDDVRAYLEYVAAGGAIAPLSVLASEGAPLPR